MWQIKQYLRHENKANENKLLAYCKASRCETVKNNKKNVFLYVKHTNLLSFKLDFQKLEQHKGSNWLIHGIKRYKDNQLQSLELPCRIS